MEKKGKEIQSRSLSSSASEDLESTGRHQGAVSHPFPRTEPAKTTGDALETQFFS